MAQIKDLTRMCKYYNICQKCPLCSLCTGLSSSFRKDADEIDEIVDNWVKEHPVKTYAMDFFEKFPDAPKDGNGIPIICMRYIYAGKQLRECLESKVDCLECWNREIKENGSN